MDFDLKTIFLTLRRRFWLIAVFVIVITTLVGVYFYMFAKPTYEASTKIIVNKTRVVNGQSEISMGDVETNIKIMSTYKDLLKTDWIMKGVAEEHPEFKLTAKALIDKINVTDSNDSQVMTFSVRDQSYPLAVEVVNAITKQFSKKIPELIEVNNITILNEADIHAQPERVSPSPFLNVVIAFIISMVFGMGLAFLKEHLDDTLKNEGDIERLLGLPTLAVINKMDRNDLKIINQLDSIKKEKVGEKTYASTN